MFARNLPEPWMIAELERMRRNGEVEGERAQIPLYPPPPPRPERSRDDAEPGRGSCVIVIELA